MALPGFGANEFLLVPLRIDDALDMTKEEYNEYLESLNPEALKFKPGKTPIFFKLRKSLPYPLHLRIENMKMDVVKKKEGDKVTQDMVPRMAYIAEEVRFAIVDIVNPPNAPEEEKLEFKRDSEGVCSPEIMSFLMSAGVYMDLWASLQVVDKKDKPNKKK